MKKKWAIGLLAAVLLIGIAAGAFIFVSPGMTSEQKQDASAGAGGEELTADLPDEAVPAAGEPQGGTTAAPTQKPSNGTASSAGQQTSQAAATTAAPYPTASGTAVDKNASVIVDYSNAKDGYVMIKWTGEQVKVAVQVTGPNNAEKYTYYLRTDGNYDVIPLSDGDGTYKFVVCKNVSGTKYASVLSASVTVQLGDSLAPFLRPNQYVNYAETSEAVKKAQELVKDATNELGKVKAVYDWVVTNLSYDYDKANTVQSGYLPDVDQVMNEKKGICFDYASLMAAMLRSQGVPVKLVVGYTNKGEYHAWLNVWTAESGWMNSVIYFDGNAWKLMDPTFASTGNQSQSVMNYIGNPENYTERFAY